MSEAILHPSQRGPDWTQINPVAGSLFHEKRHSWPFWPPLGLPERERRLRATRGFFFNPSLDGGLELFELSRPNRRRSSATSARRDDISALSEAINSSTSAGSVISPLIQIRASLSSQSRRPKRISPNCGFSDSPRLGSYFLRGAIALNFALECGSAAIASPPPVLACLPAQSPKRETRAAAPSARR